MMPLAGVAIFMKHPAEGLTCRLLNCFFISDWAVLIRCLRSLLVMRGCVLGFCPIVFAVVNFDLRLRRMSVGRC
jgi:hypothetical protein